MSLVHRPFNNAELTENAEEAGERAAVPRTMIIGAPEIVLLAMVHSSLTE